MLKNRTPYTWEINDEDNTCEIFDRNSSLVATTNDNAWAEEIVNALNSCPLGAELQNKLTRRNKEIADLKFRLNEAQKKIQMSSKGVRFLVK